MKPIITRELEALRAQLQAQIDVLKRRTVSHDSSMTGNGTASSPLSIVAAGNHAYVGRRELTSTVSGSTITLSAGVTGISLRMVAGGAGGGGAFDVVSTMGGGGASGAYLERWITGSLGLKTVTYQCGVGGAGGNNATGATGGDTVVSIDGTTYLCKGGFGGVGRVWTDAKAAGGAVQAGSSVGAIQQGGFPGMACDTNNVAGANITGGAGGSSPLGAGGATQTVTGLGKPANGYGAGGGGSYDGSTAVSLWGGSGSQGAIILDEFVSI